MDRPWGVPRSWDKGIADRTEHGRQGAQTSRRGMVRAYRASEPAQDIARSMAALALAGSTGVALQGALRAARRAARAGARGYDPARHAALLRLLKQKTPP